MHWSTIFDKSSNDLLLSLVVSSLFSMHVFCLLPVHQGCSARSYASHSISHERNQFMFMWAIQID